MEAIGAAASIVQIATTGLLLAQALYGLADESTSAKEQVKVTAFNVRATSTVLAEIGQVFEEESRVARALISRDAVVTAEEIVERCSRIFDALRNMVRDAEGSSIGMLKFGLRNSRLKVLVMELGEMKSNLQCMMQVVIYARLKAEARTTFFDESKHRRLIGDLIKEHFESAEQCRQAKSKDSSSDSLGRIPPNPADVIFNDHINTKQDGNCPTPSQSRIADCTEPTSNMSAFTAPSPATVEEKTRPSPQHDPTSRHRAPDREKQLRDVPSSRNTNGSNYLFALYYVCCPCLFWTVRGRRSAPQCPSAGQLEVSSLPPSTNRLSASERGPFSQQRPDKRDRPQFYIEPYDETSREESPPLNPVLEVASYTPSGAITPVGGPSDPYARSKRSAPPHNLSQTEPMFVCGRGIRRRARSLEPRKPSQVHRDIKRRARSCHEQETQQRAQLLPDPLLPPRKPSNRAHYKNSAKADPESEVGRMLHRWTTLYD